MSCCRQTVAPLSEGHRLKIVYRGGRAGIVTGPATGRQYRFSGLTRVLLVHPGDAVALIRDPMFHIEGAVVLPASDTPERVNDRVAATPKERAHLLEPFRACFRGASDKGSDRQRQRSLACAKSDGAAAE